MRSADRGKHGSGWEEGGLSQLTIRETAFLPQKLSARGAKMQIIDGRWEGHRSTIPLMYFIHSQQDATS